MYCYLFFFFKGDAKCVLNMDTIRFACPTQGSNAYERKASMYWEDTLHNEWFSSKSLRAASIKNSSNPPKFTQQNKQQTNINVLCWKIV